MPIPKIIARANRVGVNRVSRHIATWLPGFGVVVHRGRRSGAVYRTPVILFRTATGYAVALTYGARTDWVKNVLAAGEADLINRRRCIHVGSPRIYHDERRRAARRVERPILRLLHVSDFLALQPRSAADMQPDRVESAQGREDGRS